MNNEKNINNEKIIENILSATVIEQRANRRWGIFFKSVVLSIFIIGIIAINIKSDDISSKRTHVAIINIIGPISGENSNNSYNINNNIKKAFSDPSAKAIVLQMNSPGGSPVESNRIYSEIKRLRGKYKEKKIYAIIGDICASGCYYIAAAVDEIYADKNSLVGSIGAIISSFGFVDAMKNLGVERRIFTSSKAKSRLDPFSQITDEDSNSINEILGDIHKNFVSAVKEGRGEKLDYENEKIFSGEIFSGSKGMELGLIDSIGGLQYVMEDVIGLYE